MAEDNLQSADSLGSHEQTPGASSGAAGDQGCAVHTQLPAAQSLEGSSEAEDHGKASYDC